MLEYNTKLRTKISLTRTLRTTNKLNKSDYRRHKTNVDLIKIKTRELVLNNHRLTIVNPRLWSVFNLGRIRRRAIHKTHDLGDKLDGLFEMQPMPSFERLETGVRKQWVHSRPRFRDVHVV